jgi:hypothetical protein
VTCHGGTEPVVAASDSKDDLWIAYSEAHGSVIVLESDGTPDRSDFPEEHEMMRDPSANAEMNCNGAACHGSIVERNHTSMHSQLWGEKYKVALRAGFSSWDACPQTLKTRYEAECTSCHTTCGQCHVSRPNSVHGGFLDSHRFQRVPDVENNCTACHGSRIGNDFNGHVENDVHITEPDIHNEQGYDCFFCHQEDLHGNGASDAEIKTRYETPDLPQCVDCHGLTQDDNLYHTAHWPSEDSDAAGLSCHVCHSQSYTSCVNCHSGGVWNASEGDTEGYSEFMEFRIAYNNDNWPNHSAADEKYFLVRHVPVIKDGFREWGWSSLENWASWETWEYASPHNIRRITDQTAIAQENPAYDAGNCATNCHVIGENAEENSRRFLWEAYVDSMKTTITGIDGYPDEYIDANRSVIVDEHLPSYWPRPDYE